MLSAQAASVMPASTSSPTAAEGSEHQPLHCSSSSTSVSFALKMAQSYLSDADFTKDDIIDF